MFLHGRFCDSSGENLTLFYLLRMNDDHFYNTHIHSIRMTHLEVNNQYGIENTIYFINM